MAPRPTFLDLSNARADSANELPLKMPPHHLDVPSPRPGDVPPALSPLDAFAMRSRMLARQFEQEEQKGRRISRLPPLAVQSELASRPDYFTRSLSETSADTTADPVPPLREETSPTAHGDLTLARSEQRRPISHYPVLGDLAALGADRPTSTPFRGAGGDSRHAQPPGYFPLPRSTSPEPVDPRLNVEAPSPKVPSLTNSVDSAQSTSQPRTLTNGSTRSQRSLRSDRGLAPPKSPAYPKSPRSFQSIRSVHQDSGDEDGASSYGGSHAVSSTRKFSGSSNMSPPHSPFSTYPPSVHRSPSTDSEYSVVGAPPPKAPFGNFSRPMSGGRLSRPSLDARPSFETRPSAELPMRRPSEVSGSILQSSSVNSSRQNSQDDVKAPLAERSETPSGHASATEANPAPSYIYSKYVLPRGRTVERNSLGRRESWLGHQFPWDDEQPPPNHPQTDRKPSAASFLDTPARAASPMPSEKISGARLSARPLARQDPNPARSQSAGPQRHHDASLAHRRRPSNGTESTDRTIIAASTSLHERTRSAEFTPDEHLEIGIQAHSAGQLNKSTYHLRLAATAGLPTAMLLYALACRHGWGMRPNQEEGVKWLRRAIEDSGLEAMDVDQAAAAPAAPSPKADPAAEAQERRKRKAQFALAVYELGISYMNGWGCARDRPLAVRCYEVAGSWGDCDALAEAGYCYTEGVGCKKDLKKAAALYRKAAELGMSMAGNSWIYKPKYMDDGAPKTPEKDEKPWRTDSARTDDAVSQRTGRSRARSIWGRWKDK